MEISEQIGKVIVGNMLRKMRLETGALQRDLAVDLEMANPNYLSMIEKGTHTIPVRRLGDFTRVYKLDKIDSMCVIRLTSSDVWYAVLDALKMQDNGEKIVAKLEKATEKRVREMAKDLNLSID